MVEWEVVTISSKYQMVIPAKLRAGLGLKPGDKVCIRRLNSHFELFRVPEMEEAYGMFEGMNTELDREDEERV